MSFSARGVGIVCALCLALLVAACSKPTKEDILASTEGVTTKAKLVQILGNPESVETVGPLEKWTYRAEDGVVIFVITGENVALQSSGR